MQADIVVLLNHALSSEYDLDVPWTDFKLGSAVAGMQEADAVDGSQEAAQDTAPAAGTLLQGAELPSDTDDSSFK